ncbi:Cys/Met metabolism PLP-dependent enzyme-domain-containing protein [Phlebopus sp. FC_14]|nr:Cys/Met metabolism PLP-dependent enzyme-domain-containing protein [Phlebopus sp. FC_14]
MSKPQLDMSAIDLPTPEPDSPYRPRQPYKFSTLCATVDNPDERDQHGASSVPIYQTATFKGVHGRYDYTRSGNPTRSHLEHHIAKLSSAAHALTVSSGMAALDTILRLLKPSDVVIAGDDLYGGTNRLLTYLQTHAGITVHHVDTTEPANLTPLLIPQNNIAMVLLESPTNPLLKIVDIATIAKNVKERCPQAIVVVDNTMMSPAFQRPLEHGADIVYDSATKYLSGHHDLMAGVITCNRDDIAKQLSFIVNASGNALTPFDSFLLLRGVKTLSVRLNTQSRTASLVATYLHSLGFPTFYPGLPDHPNRDVHERISSGYGAVLSFKTGDVSVSERIVAATRLWSVSVSFGCLNSLISMPCVMSHASIPPHLRAARGLPEDLIRLCVGIEDPTDLFDDLERALIEAGAVRRTAQGIVRVETTLDQAVQKLALDGGGQESPKTEPEAENGNGQVVTEVNGPDGARPHKRQWMVSAPGKVILFGEHAVVHGVPALAASLSLRCYAIATPRSDKVDTLEAHFLDIDMDEHEGGFRWEWNIKELPWDAVSASASDGTAELTLDVNLLTALSARVFPPTLTNPHARQASLAFLYLYMVLGARAGVRPAFTLTARATLPVGAGLGSSAAFSVCAATALLLMFGRISLLPASSEPSASSVSSADSKLSTALADTVNTYAFLSEKILHGNPSGVDNSVAVYGGGLEYTKAIAAVGNGKAQEGGMHGIRGFTSHRFLLTDTLVPRNTKALVAGVGKLKEAQPEVVGAILDAIREIVGKAKVLLGGDGNVEGLGSLISENHDRLVALGVSHPSLEAVRNTTGKSPFELATKLTGAGGGGCAVTLVPGDFSSSLLASLVDSLKAQGFVPYLTEVGGPGLGILSIVSRPPVTDGLVTAPATPPETPHPASEGTQLGDGTEGEVLEAIFSKKSKTELGPWVEGLGSWAYV